jgi:hypothetical protein
MEMELNLTVHSSKRAMAIYMVLQGPAAATGAMISTIFVELYFD